MFYVVVMGASLSLSFISLKKKKIEELKLRCPEIFHPLMTATFKLNLKGLLQLSVLAV